MRAGPHRQSAEMKPFGPCALILLSCVAQLALARGELATAAGETVPVRSENRTGRGTSHLGGDDIAVQGGLVEFWVGP
jgi:hypothetical protein